MRASTKTLLSTIILLALLVGVAQAVTWSEQQKLTASDGASSDQLGRSVAVDGDTAVVGALADDDSGSNSGSAYVFVRSGGLWSEQQKLLASDGAAGDFFGLSVAVDGDTAVVGAYYDDDNGPNSGSAYVFVRSGGVWTQQQKLIASDGAADDYFGYSVAVSGDTAVAGAYQDDDSGSNSGSAYVFTRSGGVWTQQQKLTASDAAAGDGFGLSVAVDANTALVGAYQDDASGSAYVFVRSGGVWTQQQKLTASDATAGDFFGYSVAVDGDTAIAGAYQDDDSGSNSGSAYVFVRSGGIWTQQQKLTASDAASLDLFGYSVAVSGDTTVVGAYGDDDDGLSSGAAYAFGRIGGTWSEDTKLVASDAAADDRFGFSVAVSGDTALVGALRDDDSGTNSGAAYVFLGIDSIIVDGYDSGDWGTIQPTIVDPSADASNSNQDITDVYAAYSDNNVYFRVDTTATPEQSQIDIYVDNDGSGGCQQQAGRPGDTANIYDLRIIATYSAGWSASVDTCPAGSWVASGAVVNVAVVDVAEFSMTRSDFGAVSPMAFFVRYGTSTDYAPDSDDPATLVEMVSFTAEQQAGGVQVAWQTASEVDNAGFNLYRQTLGGEYAKLNAALIPAQGGPTFGTNYAYDDVEVVPGTTYAYMLEDVDVYGQATLHGPVSIEVGEMPTAVKVSSLRTNSAAAWLPTFVLVFDTIGLAWIWRRRRC